MVKSIRDSMNGYTFIELLVAITILGLVIAPFLGLFSTAFLSISGSGKQTTAVNLGREQMENVRALGYPSVYELYRQGKNPALYEDEIPGYPGFRRATTVEPFYFDLDGLSPPALELMLIEVTVSWEQRDREHEVSLASYLASDKPGGDSDQEQP